MIEDLEPMDNAPCQLALAAQALQGPLTLPRSEQQHTKQAHNIQLKTVLHYALCLRNRLLLLCRRSVLQLGNMVKQNLRAYGMRLRQNELGKVKAQPPHCNPFPKKYQKLPDKRLSNVESLKTYCLSTYNVHCLADWLLLL